MSQFTVYHCNTSLLQMMGLPEDSENIMKKKVRCKYHKCLTKLYESLKRASNRPVILNFLGCPYANVSENGIAEIISDKPYF